MKIALLLVAIVTTLRAETVYLEGFKPEKDPAALFVSVVYRYHSDKLKKGNAVPTLKVQKDTIKAVLKNAPLFWKGSSTEKAYYMMYAQTLSEGEGFPSGNIADPSYGPNCITLAEAEEICGTYNRATPSKSLMIKELETNFDLNYFVLAGTMTVRLSRYKENWDYFPRAIAGYKYGDARASDKFRALDYSSSRIRLLKPVARFENKLAKLLSLRSSIIKEGRTYGLRPARKGSKSSNPNTRRTSN